MTDLTIEDALSMLKSGDIRISAKLIETEGLSGHQKKCAEFKAFLIRTLEEHERAKKDAERIDWQAKQFVTVRIPLRYGSRECFMGSPDDNDGESMSWDIRAAIDAQIAKEQA